MHESPAPLGWCHATLYPHDRLHVPCFLGRPVACSAGHFTHWSLPPPLPHSQPELKVQYVSETAADPTLVYITLATGTGLPQGGHATVVATYATREGEPRSQRLEVALPLCAFCQVVPPVKNAGECPRFACWCFF